MSSQKPKRVAGIIPVRGGSKGLPGKNTRMLCGKPLVAWPIEAGLGSGKLESVWVTSDDDNALRLAREHGAQAYKRPAHLAVDSAPMGPVITDFGKHLLSLGDPPDAIMVMYATHPLRTAADVEEIYDAYVSSGGRAVIGVKKSHTHPYLFYKLDENAHPTTFCGIDPNQYYQRQLYPAAYELTTFACVIPLAELDQLNAQLQTPSSVALFIDPKKTYDIDTIDDFETCEHIIRKRLERASAVAAE